MNDINFTMYKLAGIIAEYDPFHNGHAWQLTQARAMGMRDGDRAEHIELDVPAAEQDPAPAPAQKGPLTLAWEAIRDTAESLLAYLLGK